MNATEDDQFIAHERARRTSERRRGRVGRDLSLRPRMLRSIIDEHAILRDLAKRYVQPRPLGDHRVLRARRWRCTHGRWLLPFVFDGIQHPHSIVRTMNIATTEEKQLLAHLGGSVPDQGNWFIVANGARCNPRLPQQVKVQDHICVRAHAAKQIEPIFLQLGLITDVAMQRHRMPRAR